MEVGHGSKLFLRDAQLFAMATKVRRECLLDIHARDDPRPQTKHLQTKRFISGICSLQSQRPPIRRDQLQEPENKEAGWKTDPEDPSKERWWNGQSWATTSLDDSSTPSPSPVSSFLYGYTSGSQTVEASPLAIGLSLAGAALVAIGVFLPRFDDGKFPTIVDNSLIQAGWGYVFLGLALTTLFLVYQFTRQEGSRFSVLAVGAIVLVGAIYMGTGDRMNLTTTVPRGYDQFGKLPDRKYEEQASPGTGTFTVGAGGLLIAFGGTLLAGLSLGGVTAAPMKRTKTCPDCAETVLADARVCKHCGKSV